MIQVLRILFICTGNICRSPMAEALFRRKLIEEYPALLPFLDIGSAGIAAIEGSPATYSAMQAMDLWGIDLEAHQASPLGHALLNDTALILTMAREHLLVVGRLDPPALQRSTTLKCLAEAGEWLMSRIDEGAVASEKQASQRIKSVLAFLGERYSGQEFLADMQSRSSDIIDPIGSSLRVYIDVLEDIERCLAAVMPVLFGRPAEPQ